MHYGLAYPSMSYNIVVWGQAVGIDRLFIAQKRLIRLIFNLSLLTSCRNYFINNRLLTLPCIYLYSLLKHIKKDLNKFELTGDQHRYPTRFGHLHRSSQHSTALFEKSPNYAALKLYDELPKAIRDITNLTKFKVVLRQFLIDKCFYSISEYDEFAMQ